MGKVYRWAALRLASHLLLGGIVFSLDNLGRLVRIRATQHSIIHSLIVIGHCWERPQYVEFALSKHCLRVLDIGAGSCNRDRIRG